MTTPIKESILANVKTTIDGVTTAAGYNQTLTTLRRKRVNYEYNNPANGLSVITWGGDKKKDGASNLNEKTMLVEIYTFVIAPANDDDIDPLLSQVSADIEKIMLVDEQRNSLALDTRWISTDPMPGDINEGVSVIFEIDYRTNWGDPYNQPS